MVKPKSKIQIKSKLKSNSEIENQSSTSFNKRPSSIIECIKLPLIFLAGWEVLGVIVSFISVDWYFKIFSGTLGLHSVGVYVLGFAIAAWLIVNDQNKSIGSAVKSIALMGLALGVLRAISNFVMITLNPAWVDAVVMFATLSYPSVDPQLIVSQMEISKYVGFISAPISNAIIAALSALVGGFIAKKKWIKL